MQHFILIETFGAERLETFCIVRQHISLPPSYCVQRKIDGGPVKICSRMLDPLRREPSSEQAQEDCLNNVFGILRITGHTKGCTENEFVVLFENSTDFVRQLFPATTGEYYG